MQKVNIKFTIIDILLLCYATIAVLNILLISSDEINLFRVTEWCMLLISYIIAKQTHSKSIIIWGVFILGTLEAFIGLCQRLNILDSTHTYFKITGTFGNPGPFGGLLAISLTVGIGILCNIKLHSYVKYAIYILLILQILAIILSDSRAGWLAAIVGCGYIYFTMIKQKKVFFILAPTIILTGLFLFFNLYQYKKDSADGRILIWTISTKMIVDSPILGHGIGSFKQKYMYYQANYFINNPSSKYKFLADNVIHPYNEFIYIGIELGVIAVLLLLLILTAIVIDSSININNIIIRGAFFSLLIFSIFSYPSQIFILSILCFLLIGGMKYKTKILSLNLPYINNLQCKICIIFICLFITSRYQYYIMKNNLKKLYTVPPSEVHYSKEYIEKHYNQLKSIPQFWDIYAQYCFKNQPDTKTLSILEKAATLIPTSELLCDLGDLHLILHQSDKARYYYKLSANMIPNRIMPKYKLFQLYYHQKHFIKMHNIGQCILSTEVKIENSRTLQIKEEVRRILRDSIQYL